MTRAIPARHGQASRLKRRAEFLRVASKGRKTPSPGLVLQVMLRDDDAPVRLGFTVTKKVGNAVVRNRTRRRLREAARLLLRESPAVGADLVLVGRDTTRKRSFALLIDDLRRGLAKLGVRSTTSAASAPTTDPAVATSPATARPAPADDRGMPPDLRPGLATPDVPCTTSVSSGSTDGATTTGSSTGLSERFAPAGGNAAPALRSAPVVSTHVVSAPVVSAQLVCAPVVCAPVASLRVAGGGQ